MDDPMTVICILCCKGAVGGNAQSLLARDHNIRLGVPPPDDLYLSVH